MSTTEIIVTLIVAIIGSSGLATAIQILVTRHFQKKDKKEEDYAIIKEALEALAHDAYFRHCRYILMKDEVTEDDLDNHKYLWKAYHGLGLNGTGERMHQLVLEKPVKANHSQNT